MIATVLDGAGSALVRADDLATVARAVADGLGGRRVAIDQLPEAIADARQRATAARAAPEDAPRLRMLADRVIAAERLVTRTLDHEDARAAAFDDDAVTSIEVPASPPPTEADVAADPTDDAHLDRQTVRFALIILVLAQIGGLAVYAADGELLAPLVPAVALAGLGAVVLRHRRPTPAAVPGESAEPEAPAVPSAPVHVPPTAAVRAAEAHLRRQQAAWKVAWWEEGRQPPDPASWSPESDERSTWTLVAVDGDGALDVPTFTSLTSDLPDAVRVVVVAPPARAGG